MSNKWVSVKILAAPFFLESLSAQLFAMGAQGIQEGENHFVVYFAEQNWNQDAYLALLKLLQSVLADFDETRLVITSQYEENWLEKWKQSFKPFRIGQRIMIIPDWEDYSPAQNELVLKIAPKMAFGTGHHETTQLCLLIIEKHIQPTMRLLDAGTGSGILSIFAAKLGNNKILGIDNDPIAIDNARENARLNRVQDRIQFEVRDVADLPAGHFDFIVANINRNVLLEIARGLTSALAKNGLLVLSGILKSDREQVEKVYLENGLKLLEHSTLKEWLALVFKKEGL